MKNIRTYIISIISSLLIACSAVYSSAEDRIVILDYSLKPVAYVSDGAFVETAWSIELSNPETKPLSFVIKFKFLDKKKKQIIETKEKCEMEANETKKYSGKILLKSSLAEKVASTTACIEDIH